MTTKAKNGKLDINKTLDDRFRALVARRFPDKKGKFKLAAEEAVEDWCMKVEKQLETPTK